jgi:hypothetical protein
MRDHLAHRYFDTAHAILQATVDEDLPHLEHAVQALTRSIEKEDPDTRSAQGDRASRIPGGSRARGRLIGTTGESSMIISLGAQIRSLCAPSSTESADVRSARSRSLPPSQARHRSFVKRRASKCRAEQATAAAGDVEILAKLESGEHTFHYGK